MLKKIRFLIFAVPILTLVLGGFSVAEAAAFKKDKASVTYAKNYAKKRMSLVYKWSTTTQYSCLNQVYIHESTWRWWANNPSSSAYGIPQALPGSKMRSAGADYRTNPGTQVKWGLSYIKHRYGTPCKAWSFWKRHHWY
ncbi:MAG: hypothetical protein JWN01_1052 [Patescibacteria group bacterium]|nr:hypothetical protein [Patescibacteria group bacterium]